MTLNYLKAAIALVALVCLTILTAVGAMDSNQSIPIITMIVGYAIGNGIAAKSGDYQPLISKKDSNNGSEEEG